MRNDAYMASRGGGAMKQGYLLFMVLVGAMILGMRSGIADGVLALGHAKGGPIYGWAAGFSKSSADAALNECRGKYKCEVVATFHDQCFAISSNGSATQWKSPIGFGLAIAKDSATAAQEATGQCESMAGQGAPPCVIRKSDCEGSAK